MISFHYIPCCAGHDLHRPWQVCRHPWCPGCSCGVGAISTQLRRCRHNTSATGSHQILLRLYLDLATIRRYTKKSMAPVAALMILFTVLPCDNSDPLRLSERLKDHPQFGEHVRHHGSDKWHGGALPHHHIWLYIASIVIIVFTSLAFITICTNHLLKEKKAN